MKIAIVGAGISGLYLGWKLRSERGHQVTIFEKKGKIGREACSGLFSERILSFVPTSQKLIEHEISSVLIHFPKKTTKVKFSKKFLVLNHAELDRLVAGLAQKAGAEIKLNQNILAGSFLANGFDRVIGCDGAHSAVRRSLGLKEPDYRLGIQGFIPGSNQADYVETWPVAHGFIWKIPRGKELEYGIIADASSAPKILDGFCSKNNLRLENMKSALIPQGFIIPKNDKIALCGDAAGLTKPWSGGGVIWGLTGAELLLKALPDFLKYQRDMKNYFLPKIFFSKMAVKTAYFLGFKIPWILPQNIKIESDFLL